MTRNVARKAKLKYLEDALDLLFSIICGLLLFVGFLGTFVPILPGAPLAFAGLIFAYFSDLNEISLKLLIITGVVSVVVSVVDNILPVTMTKNVGGSKNAVLGSTVGLIFGFFAGPLGIIIGPFLGALVGELVQSEWNWSLSIKSAFGAFWGFLLGTGMKMIAVIWFIWIFATSFV